MNELVDNDPIGGEMMKSFELFVSGIEAHENLELIGEFVDDAGKTILVVEDSTVIPDELSHQTVIDLAEVFSAIRDQATADRFVAVVAREENPIKLQGITRIVGYYSRVNNWNKSKVGELRDRAKGKYGREGFQGKHEEERLKVINSH